MIGLYNFKQAIQQTFNDKMRDTQDNIPESIKHSRRVIMKAFLELFGSLFASSVEHCTYFELYTIATYNSYHVSFYFDDIISNPEYWMDYKTYKTVYDNIDENLWDYHDIYEFILPTVRDENDQRVILIRNDIINTIILGREILVVINNFVYNVYILPEILNFTGYNPSAINLTHYCKRDETGDEYITINDIRIPVKAYLHRDLNDALASFSYYGVQFNNKPFARYYVNEESIVESLTGFSND